eukprot:6120052-Prymnesium_polylepis.1
MRHLRAPTKRADWASRGRPAPIPPGRIHASEARRPHARRTAAHKLPEARPDVATVGRLCPRRSAAADAL